MDKRILICIAIILSIGALVILFFYYFEIVQKKVPAGPSQEYYDNSFLALERWLNETGRPVRTIYGYSSVETINENTILGINLYDLLFGITEEELLQLAKSGKNVILCLTLYNITSQEKFNEFLSGMGITAGTTPSYWTYTNENMPDLHWNIKFDIEDGRNYYTIKDMHNNIRIIKIEMGEGTLTIMGSPGFMQYESLKKELNACLAWELIGEISDETGVLFVKPYKEPHERKSFFGALMQRGNLVPVLASIILLIIFGFWSVIPFFGQAKKEKQNSSRPIKERFEAEISFLKKYKGLYYYNDAINKLRGNDDERNKS